MPAIFPFLPFGQHEPARLFPLRFPFDTSSHCDRFLSFYRGRAPGARVGGRALVARVGGRAPVARVGGRALVARVGGRAPVARVGGRALRRGLSKRALYSGIGDRDVGARSADIDLCASDLARALFTCVAYDHLPCVDIEGTLSFPNEDSTAA